MLGIEWDMESERRYNDFNAMPIHVDIEYLPKAVITSDAPSGSAMKESQIYVFKYASAKWTHLFNMCIPLCLI